MYLVFENHSLWGAALIAELRKHLDGLTYL